MVSTNSSRTSKRSPKYNAMVRLYIYPTDSVFQKLLLIIFTFASLIANDYKCEQDSFHLWACLYNFTLVSLHILSYVFLLSIHLPYLVSRTSAVLENEKSEIWAGFIWNVEGSFSILIFFVLSSLPCSMIILFGVSKF